MTKKTKTTFRKVLSFLSLIVVIVLAAGCIQQEQATPTTESEPTPVHTAAHAVPTPTVVSQPLILMSMESDSPRQIGLNESFSFSFNQPVEQQSFEDNFHFQPDVEGIFEWIDETSVLFTPSEALEMETHYTIEIAGGIYAKSGVSLETSIQQNFITVGPLQLTSNFPENEAADINIHSPIWVSFNQPISSEIGMDEPVPFSIEPVIPGAGRWANASTYIFYPSEELVSNTTYTLTYQLDLTGQYGTGYETAPKDTSFTTQAPDVVSITPEDLSTLEPGQDIMITFNQEMDQESVFANLRLEDKNSDEIHPEFVWNEDNTQLTIIGGDTFPRSDTIKLVLNPAAKTRTGIPLHDSMRREYTTLPRFDIDGLPESSMTVSYNGYAELAFHFNVPLDPMQDFLGLIDVRNRTPSDFTYSLDETQQILTYSGFFQPGTFYSYSLSPDLHDEWGQPLGEAVFKRFATQSAPTAIIVNQHDVPLANIFIPLNDINIPVETTNIRRVDMQSIPLSIEDYLQLYCDTPDCLQNQEFAFDRYWYQSISPYIVNASLPTELTMTPRTKQLEAGIYVFELGSPDLKNREPLRFFGIAANTQLTAQVINDDLLIWAIDLNTFEPVQDAPVLIYDSAGNVLNGGTTDARGLLTISDIGSGLIHIAMYQPGHPEFGFNTINLDEVVNSFQTQTSIHTEFFFDRPTYHPGETVNYLLYGNFEEGEEINLALQYAYQGQVDTVDETMLTFAVGTAMQGSFRIPESLPLGTYSLSVNDELVQEIPTSEKKTTELDLKIEFAQDSFAFGEIIKGAFRLNLGDEIPIPEQEVEWTAAIFPENMEFNGKCTTDETGECEFELPQTIYNTLNANQTYTVILSAGNERGNLSTNAAINLYPGQFQIDMETETWLGNEGEAIGVELFTRQHDGEVFPSIELNARFEKINFVDVSSFVDGKQIAAQEIETVQIASNSFTTDENGYARLTFTPPEAGVYRVVTNKDTYEEELWVYVNGEVQGTWPENEKTITTIMDQESYAPGETAQLFLPNLFITAAKVLLTVQSQTEYREQIVTVEGAGAVVDLAIKESDAPLLSVSMTFIGLDAEGILDYRESTIEIPIDEEKAQLLNLNSSLEFTGEMGLFKLDVQDGNDEPVQAAYSLLILPSDWLIALPTDTVYFSQQTELELSSFFTNSLKEYIRLNGWYPPPTTANTETALPTAISSTKPFNGNDTIFLTNLTTNEEGSSFIEFPFPLAGTDYTYFVMAVSPDGTTGFQQNEVLLPADSTPQAVVEKQLVFSGVLSSSAQVDIALPIPYGITEKQWQVELFADDLTAIQSISGQPEIDENQPVSIASALLTVQAINELTSQEQQTDKLLNLLLSLQNEDGGWGYLSDSQSSVEVTTYAAWSLIQSGLLSAIDQEQLALLEQYLTNVLESGYVSTPSVKYALQALTLEYQELESAAVQLDELSTSEQTFLVLALLQQPDTEELQAQVIEHILNDVIYDENGVYFSGDHETTLYSSDASISALILFTLSQSGMQSDLIPELRSWLIHEEMTFQVSVPTAQALTLTALQDSMQYAPQSTDYGIEVRSSQSAFAVVTAAEIINQPYQAEMTVSADSPTVSIIHKEGEGNLYYRFSAEQAIENELANGITIQQNFYPIDAPCRPGNCTPAIDFTLGEEMNLIEGHLTLIVSENLAHVIIALPITTDFEIYPTSDVFAGLIPPIDSPLAYGMQSDSFEISKDNNGIRWYATELPAGTYELIYYLKPSAQGELAVPSIQAYGQFNGILYAETIPTTLTITMENADE